MGPPWEKRQNGYLLRETVTGGVSLFYEPHCDYGGESVRRAVPGPVDVMVAPVLNQDLIAYPLVRGVQLLRLGSDGEPVGSLRGLEQGQGLGSGSQLGFGLGSGPVAVVVMAAFPTERHCSPAERGVRGWRQGHDAFVSGSSSSHVRGGRARGASAHP